MLRYFELRKFASCMSVLGLSKCDLDDHQRPYVVSITQ